MLGAGISCGEQARRASCGTFEAPPTVQIKRRLGRDLQRIARTRNFGWSEYRARLSKVNLATCTLAIRLRRVKGRPQIPGENVRLFRRVQCFVPLAREEPDDCAD